MLKKTLISVASVALASWLTACGGSPDADESPAASTPAAGATSASGATDTTPSAAPASSSVPRDTSGPPSASATDVASSTGEIPPAIRGKWITVGEGEKARDCTQEVESEGAIITIDATKIASFAFVLDLESITESSASSVEGVFEYRDDSDELITPTIRLATQDDWQTLEFVELNTDSQAPAIYARCS